MVESAVLSPKTANIMVVISLHHSIMDSHGRILKRTPEEQIGSPKAASKKDRNP